MTRTLSIIPLLLALSALTVVNLSFKVFPGLEKSMLVTPSARVASALSGSPLALDIDEQWLLYVSTDSPQKVTTACSGKGFLSLIIALVFWQWGERHLLRAKATPSSKPELIDVLRRASPLILAYPYAVTVNACRIALSGWSSYYGNHLLGPQFHDITHMTMGGVVFLTALIVFNHLIAHAYRQNPSASKADTRNA